MNRIDLNKLSKLVIAERSSYRNHKIKIGDVVNTSYGLGLVVGFEPYEVIGKLDGKLIKNKKADRFTVLLAHGYEEVFTRQGLDLIEPQGTLAIGESPYPQNEISCIK